MALPGSTAPQRGKNVTEEKPDFYPLPNGNGIMDQKMKDFLESKESDPTQKKLDEMLKHVDKVSVEELHPKKEIFSTSDPKQISSFKDSLKISEDPQTFGHCMCYGDPQIYLYSGGKRIAHLSCQHGFAIRWNDGWKWDAVLKEGSLLTEWLAVNGAPQLKKSVEEDRLRAEESRRCLQKWLAAMPPCLKPAAKEILGDGSGWNTFTPSGTSKGKANPEKTSIYAKYWDALKAAYPHESDKVLALLNWFGSGAGPWSGFPSYESFPEGMLSELDTKTILQAVKSRDLSETQLEGTARYFGGWTFRSQKKADMHLVPNDLKKKLLEHSLKSTDKDKLERARSAFDAAN